ncbi:c-type cytochrome [Mycetohabitans endofungorum]|uniref:c-type cytochrome n=1 Tax=Mycetohabitans endofungorum TaxID=417203 RepID=UPI0030CAF886
MDPAQAALYPRRAGQVCRACASGRPRRRHRLNREAQVPAAPRRDPYNRVTHRMLAPSFRQIAAHYAHQPDASVRLQRKIIDGGAGTWGNAPMPANTQITDAQAAALAAWILQLR